MCAVFRALLLTVVFPICAAAQPAPTVVSTLVTTNTGATSVCVGANSVSAPTSCIGAVKLGTLKFTTSVTATADGTIQKTAASGLTLLGVAGSSYDFALFIPSGATRILSNPTGTSTMLFEGAAQWGTSISPIANGTIQKSATLGLLTLGVAGSISDWSVYTPSGGSAVLTNPTGTQSVLVGGSLGVGANITDMNTTPTVSAGFGSGNSIVGKAFAFVVNVGSSSGNNGTVAFNGTFANAPVCVVSSTDSVHLTTLTTTTTNINLLSGATGWDDSTVINVLCRGY